MDNGQKVITIAHLERSSDELKMPTIVSIFPSNFIFISREIFMQS